MALITNYTFNASAKTVTLTDYVTIDILHMRSVYNMSTLTYIYQEYTDDGSCAGNVFTFGGSNDEMSDTDLLRIYYDDTSTTTYIPVNTISIASANGFGGSSSGGTTPTLTLNTTITGLLAGNGTALYAAVSGTDIKTVGGFSLLGSGDIPISGGSMVYPGAGIALSTGSAWDTSITDNSATWNTALQDISGQDLSTADNSTSAFTTLAAVAGVGYLTSVSSGDVTTALGYTPYDALNPANYTTLSAVAGVGYITGISSGDVLTALGFTPYDASNPSNYISSLAGAVLTNQATPQTIGTTGDRLAKLWATDITLTNALVGSVTGNAGTVTNGVYTTGADTVYLTPATAASTYQPLDGTLSALAGLTIAANSLSIGTGTDAFTQTTFAANTFPARSSSGNLVAKTITDFALTILDDTTASDTRTTLGLGTLATQSGTFSGTSSGTNTGDNATNSQYSGLAASKQDTLVSGTNIKTVNGTSLLGSGDVTISGGATTALDNLVAVAINTSLISDTNDTDSLGSTGIRWKKGWFTDVESTNMPTVGGTAILTSLTAPTFTTIEIGAASTDTTLSRSSAGVLAVEGVVIPSISSTNTLTNKRITKRVVTAADATSITPNTDNADITYQLNTQAAGTLTINVDAGVPTNGQAWLLKVKCTNAQTFAWDSSFIGGATSLPTATTGNSKIDYYSFIYDTVSSKWDFTGSALSFS